MISLRVGLGVGRFVAVVLAACCLSCGRAKPQGSPKAFVAETVLRASATSAAPPLYPEASVRRFSRGVAVAKVQLADTGRLESLEVLQAPDPLIARAVQKAVRLWVFKPVVSARTGQPIAAEGKMFFYFEIQDGEGVVLTANEAARTHGWSSVR
jgi:outer membrane biosynthesis protein TonB